MILLDTNVVSEPLRPKPDTSVMRWLNNNFADCAISSIVIFELRVGVSRLHRGKRREALEVAVERAIRRFGARIYSFDTAAAHAAAQVFALARSSGRGAHGLPDQMADLQTAGIAVANGFKLATRNIGDFKSMGIELVDPWGA